MKKTTKEIFTAQAEISKITTMADHGLRLQVDTQDLPPEEEAIIFASRNKAGYFLYSISEIKESDVANLPDLAPVEKDMKSPSKRLRDRMFVYYQKAIKDSVGCPDFDTWYIKEMDRIGLKYLERVQ